MTATYDLNLSRALDRMRLALGDTKVSPETSALIPDETYLAKLTELGETEATAALAESLATRFAQEPDSVGEDGDTVSWKDRVRTWMELAKRLRVAVGVSWAVAASAVKVARVQRADATTESEYERPEWWTP